MISSTTTPLKILLTGGAGYIGSHTALTVAMAGFEPIFLANLPTAIRPWSTGFAQFAQYGVHRRARRRFGWRVA